MFASSHFNPGHPLPQTHINSFKCNSALTTSKTILLDKLLYDCLLTFHAILNTGELTHPFKKTLILWCISVQLQIPYIGYKNSFNEMEYALHIHNFNFKCNEIYIKTSFRTLNSFTFIKMWRVLINLVNSLQMARNLKAFLLSQFKLQGHLTRI